MYYSVFTMFDPLSGKIRIFIEPSAPQENKCPCWSMYRLETPIPILRNKVFRECSPGNE